MTQLWCNGQWIDALDFPVSPTDRGLLAGFGLFETVLAVDGRPIFVERHLARLRGACERLGWAFNYPDLGKIMTGLIEMNELGTGRCRIRLAITGGSGVVHDISQGGDHLVWMTAVPAVDAPLSLSANLSPWMRNERSALAGLKCASYAENLVALDHAVRQGFQETVFLNTTGRLCEAATSNLFLVKNGGISTPGLESGCLPGITRAVVIELAVRHGIPCQECDLTLADLHAADELFLTSSIRSVMGVSRFEGRMLEPGRVTSAMREAWKQAVLGEIGH